LPTKKELSDTERQKSSHRFALASGDFNGDGVPDRAFLVKRNDGRGEGLIVRLSKPGRRHTWVTLSDSDYGAAYPDAPLVMGIETVPPGTYEYNCIETADDCVGSDTGKSKITLRQPAIEYFKFESAASAFYWDAKKNSFIRIWISD
jgi:hypothetical protein